MKRVTLVLLSVSVCLGIPQQGTGNLADLINGVFTPAPPIAGPNSASPANTTNKSNVFLGSQNVPTTRTDCECVPYYQCRNGKILEDGIDLIDIRVTGGECEHYLDVCCKPPDRQDPTDPVTPAPTPTPNQRQGCGYRNANGVGFRITGQTDNEAQFAEFPWMVAVLSERPNSNGTNSQFFECGGSLIHTRAVLTAAHCVNGKVPSQITIRAGEWDTQTRNEVLPHQDRKVQSIIMHENYHSSALRNDFAILILAQPVDIASNVDVVCLAEMEQVFDGSRCFVTGWGKSSFGKEGKYSVILKRVDVPTVPHDACQNALRTTRLGKYFVLDRSFMCAGGEIGKDTCQGDGGGPLVCPVPNDPNRYIQAGIVAWGIGCGQETPAVYGNVAKARKWIDDQMRRSNLDVNTYQYSFRV